MTLVERMARAVAGSRWDEWDADERRGCMDQMVMVLEAMTAPTEAMLEQVDNYVSARPRFIWEEMVIAAIAEAEA